MGMPGMGIASSRALRTALSPRPKEPVEVEEVVELAQYNKSKANLSARQVAWMPWIGTVPSCALLWGAILVLEQTLSSFGSRNRQPKPFLVKPRMQYACHMRNITVRIRCRFLYVMGVQLAQINGFFRSCRTGRRAMGDHQASLLAPWHTFLCQSLHV